MEIKNCKRCGKMYSYIAGIPICDQCKQKDEDDFQTVKKYIYEHKGVSLKEVSEACEVSVEKITRFLRDGRLEIKEGTNIILECESCGRPINSGRLCQECSKKLERDLSKASNTAANSNTLKEKNEEEGKAKGGGMRYLKS